MPLFDKDPRLDPYKDILRNAFSNFARNALERIDRKAAIPNLLKTMIPSMWFTECGDSYYFLFRKNASVTDISFSELLSLIRIHSEYKAIPHIRPAIQFRSSKQFKEFLLSLWQSLGESISEEEIKGKNEFIVNNYFSFFSNTILLDPLFGSAVVHVPYTLKIDLPLICGESGYIHSCGDAIFVRKTTKSKKAALLENLERYINKHFANEQVTFFTTYSHEQFTQYERSTDEPELRHGLHDVKIYLDKFHLDGMPLYDLLREIKENSVFKDRMYIPHGKLHYKEERDKFKKKHKEKANKDVTIWLLVEKSLMPNELRYPGKDRYFICYAQRYANRNPFVLFEEEKPGWIAPTTLPHTLTAAMLNVARPYFHVNNEYKAIHSTEQPTVCVIDPFSGTGTTFLESIKLPDNIKFVGSDNHPMSMQVISDNIKFFSLTNGYLRQKFESLNSLLKEENNVPRSASVFVYPHDPEAIEMPKESRPLKELIAWAINVFACEFPKISSSNFQELQNFTSHEFKFSLGSMDGFKTGDEYLWTRIIFYLVWRAMLKNRYKIGAGVEDIGSAIKKEFSGFNADLEKLKNLREQNKLKQLEKSKLCVYEGLYSCDCIVPETLLSKEIKSIADNIHEISSGKECDVEEMLRNKRGIFDLIITDPPYGFNTSYDEGTDLANLYNRALEEMVIALKDEGQIIFCLPAESYSGQRISYFSTKEIVIRQLLFIAESAEKEVIYRGAVKPHPPDLFRPPYYWHSERALTRTILHFRLRKKPVENNELK